MPTRAANNVHVMHMCQAFQRAGYDTTLFAPRASADERDIQDIWSHFHIESPFVIRLLPTLSVLRKYDAGLLAALYARFRRDTLVYARFMPGAAIAAHMGIPSIFEAHGPQTNPTVLRKLLRNPNLVRFVTTTHAVKNHYLATFSDHITPEKISVEPDATELPSNTDLVTRAAARQAINIPAARFVAVYVGHLYAGRGIELIVDLAQRLSDVHFMVVGGAEADIACWRAKITEEQINNLEFVGFVRNVEVPLYLSAADILLMPYQKQVSVYKSDVSTASWMSPMKMFEYMAANRPIISSDLPVLREILNENNAMLCPPDSVDQWVSAIRQLQNDSAQAKRLADQARLDVEQYTWDKRVERLLATRF